MTQLELVTLVVREYDPSIQFFVEVLGFDAVYSRLVAVFRDLEGNRWDLLGPR